jgi:hypothetical protein
MSFLDFDLKQGVLARTNTPTSPTLAYSKQLGYDGYYGT